LGALLLSGGESSAGSGVVSGLVGLGIAVYGYYRERFGYLTRLTDSPAEQPGE
jgi:hypothetical protein